MRGCIVSRLVHVAQIASLLALAEPWRTPQDCATCAAGLVRCSGYARETFAVTLLDVGDPRRDDASSRRHARALAAYLLALPEEA